jgi:transcriptional regulator with XRE-family HTH domain
MPTPTQLAAVVSRLLTEAGISQREASRATNIPPPTLSRRLNGSPFLSTELALLARLLGTTVSRLTAEAESLAATADKEAV